MIHLILSFFLFANPCFANFACGDEIESQIATTHVEKEHEGTKCENHHDQQHTEAHQNDHCSTHCTHTFALSSVNVSFQLKNSGCQKLQSEEFLYLSPIVESLKRPPISA